MVDFGSMWIVERQFAAKVFGGLRVVQYFYWLVVDIGGASCLSTASSGEVG